MNIPFLTRLCKRRQRQKIRVIMRGYRILKRNNQISVIRGVKRDLANAHITGINETANLIFFGEGKSNAELIVRQYAITRVGGVGLNKALFYSIGKKNTPVIYPLPKEFQYVLIQNGFKVSSWRCSILWTAYIGLLWCYGMFFISKHIYNVIRSIFRPDPMTLERATHFIGLKENNLPQPSKDGRSFDIITWYTNWQGCPSSLTVVRHDVRGTKSAVVNGMRVEFAEHLVLPLNNISSLIRFLFWAMISTSLATVNIFRGRWWDALLLAEAAKAAIVRLAKPSQLACDYMFHNSDTFYRPIWTYEAMKKGSRIISYFYSTFEDLKIPSGYQPNSTFWKLMNWPLYLVWDKYQEELVWRNVDDLANTNIVGPIWFSDSAFDLPKIPSNSIAVFDIQPFRSSAHFGISTMIDLNYGDPKISMKFIQDIDYVVSLYGGSIAYKRKRDIGNLSHKCYRFFISILLKNIRFISVQPDISSIRVIEKCRAVISMPFTSTAILGSELGKPSIYYDPTGKVQKDDRGAHGIPILNGKDELQLWVSSVLNQNQDLQVNPPLISGSK